MDLYLWGIARSSQIIGISLLQRGDFENAKYFFEQHLRIDERLHFKQGIVAALTNLGDLFRYMGDFTQSELFYQKGLQMAREYGLPLELSEIHFLLGMLGLQQNDYPMARQRFLKAFKLVWSGEEKLDACNLLIGLAAVAAGTGQPDRAARLTGAAWTVLVTTDYRYPPFEQAELDRHIHLARVQAGEVVFEMVAAEGGALTLEQAVAYALQGGESTFQLDEEPAKPNRPWGDSDQ